MMSTVAVFVLGQVLEETSNVVNKTSSADKPLAASPSSSDSELEEDFLTEEPCELDGNANNYSKVVEEQESTDDDSDDDVDLKFYPQRNGSDEASSNSIVTGDHKYVRISAMHDANVMIKQEPPDVDYEDGVSELGSRYMWQNNHGLSEVKTETTDDFYSASLDSFGSDSDGSSYDPEKWNDLETSDSESGEPARKKIRVAFGVDPATDESAMTASIVIDSDVWEDPKMHMTPVIELEDILEIILAWQQNIAETDDAP